MSRKRTTITLCIVSSFASFLIGTLTVSETKAHVPDELPAKVAYVGAVYVPTSTTPSQGTVYLVTEQGQLVPAGTPFVKR